MPKPLKSNEVRAESKDPYYLEIANRLREELGPGTFRPGQRFYSIRGLIKETGRSLPTVRSALGLLIKEGLLEARQGSGYYVTAQVGARTPARKGFFNYLAVIPSSTVPDEPWFTGRIGLGMIHAANQDHAVVSFYKRQAPDDRSPELARVDLERITAMKPDGIAWLHSLTDDAPLLKELQGLGVPIVTTMRRVPEVELPLVREDDIVYASMVLSNFAARGHKRIGIILRSLTDDYFRSKMDAFKEVSGSSQLRVDDQDLFFLPPSDLNGEQQAGALADFLEARKELTGLLVLASTGIRPIIKLYDTPLAARIGKMSIIYNVLDGVAVPTLPTGESLATIFPPLEKMGEQLVHFLTAEANKVPALTGAYGGVADCAGSPSTGADLVKVPRSATGRLIPIFQPGDSLKLV